MATDTFGVFPVAARDLAWDARRSLLWLSVGSGPEVEGSRVIAVDPETLTIEREIPVGVDPGPMAISEDGDTLYVGLRQSGAVRPVDLVTAVAAPGFALQRTPTGDREIPMDLVAVPGVEGGLLVSGLYRGAANVSVYDAGAARTAVFVAGGAEPISLAVSNASTAYGLGTSDVGRAMWAFSIRADGIREARITGDVVPGAARIVFEGGRLFSDAGHVVDPLDFEVVGVSGVVGSVAAEQANDRLYVLARSAGTTEIVVLRRTSLSEVTRVRVESPGGAPSDLVRWGDHGFAFLEGAVGDSPAARLVVVTSDRLRAP